jgi:serine/threonine protein kinase
MYSKNDVFTTDWSVRPPPSIIIKPLNQKQQQQQPSTETATRTAAPVKTHVYTNEEYAASEQVLDPPSESDGLEVKLSLQNGELGHGRHASVYLALYRDTSGSSNRDTLNSVQINNQWKLCAAKRFIPGKEAQVACFSEAAMLSRLSSCSQILHYIGLKDERPVSRPSSSRSSSASGFPAEEDKGDELNPSSMDTKDFPDRRSPSCTRSSTSQSTPSSPVTLPSTNKDDLSIPPLLGFQRPAIEDNKASSSSGLRRNATVKAPKSPSRLGHSTRKILTISTLSLGEEAPRMLLLTEYCHLGNLATFVKDHGQQVLGINMFFKFAIDLMKAVVAVHDRNIIHGDIKPQNCMVRSICAFLVHVHNSSRLTLPTMYFSYTFR